MKKVICLSIFLSLNLYLFSQMELSGSAKVTLGGNISKNNEYESLLNPSNIGGIRDINLNSSLLGKLESGDDRTSLSIWFSFKEYKIGQALLSAAYGNEIQEAGVYEIIKTQGDSILYLNLLRFSSNIYITDNLSLEVGRHSMLTGYGWGWNPMDFANPLKNPLDPDAAFKGVDGISLKSYILDIATLKIYGILPLEPLISGLDYRDIKVGGELTLYFTGFEGKLTGIYDYDSDKENDSYPTSLGGGFLVDLFGIGLYGEFALRDGSRNNFIVKDMTLKRKTSWLYSYLIGAEYTFVTDTYLTAEYFFNGEGYNDSERDLFSDTVTQGLITSDLISLYRLGYFAKHYVMINVVQQLYDFNSEINLSGIYSIDSGALTVTPSINYTFTGNFSLKVSYIGLYDLLKDDFSEVTELPVNHIVTAAFIYDF